MYRHLDTERGGEEDRKKEGEEWRECREGQGREERERGAIIFEGTA